MQFGRFQDFKISLQNTSNYFESGVITIFHESNAFKLIKLYIEKFQSLSKIGIIQNMDWTGPDWTGPVHILFFWTQNWTQNWT